MAEYKYLFELDSVNISAFEMIAAEDSLYDEICEGNIIVLSFNQIADSLFFMKWIQDEDMGKVLFSLINDQKIVVSQYRGMTSCVEYVLRKLIKSIATYRSNDSKGVTEFFLSSLPFLSQYPTSIRITIYEKMRDALAFSDVERLNELENDPKMDTGDVERVKRYIRFLLEVNLSKIQYTKSLSDAESFSDCLAEMGKNGAFSSDSVRELFKKVTKGYSDRSTVLRNLKKADIKEDDKKEIETAVNIAYNMDFANNIRVQDGTKTIPLMHSLSFEKDFLKQFTSFYLTNKHNFICQRVDSGARRLYNNSYNPKKNWNRWKEFDTMSHENKAENSGSVSISNTYNIEGNYNGNIAGGDISGSPVTVSSACSDTYYQKILDLMEEIKNTVEAEKISDADKALLLQQVSVIEESAKKEKKKNLLDSFLGALRDFAVDVSVGAVVALIDKYLS